MFSKYGDIVSALVMHDSDGKSLGFGFVCFKHPESAARALLDLNGSEGLYVKPALKKEQREMEVRVAAEKFKKSMQKFNLYVKNFSPDTTEEELKEHFAKFGQVNNVKIMRQPVPQAEEVKEAPKCLGFGFVSFTTTDAAARAKLESKTLTFKGVYLYVAQFESKEVRKAHLAEMRDKRQLDSHRKAHAMTHFQDGGSGGGLSQILNQSLQGITWL